MKIYALLGAFLLSISPFLCGFDDFEEPQLLLEVEQGAENPFVAQVARLSSLAKEQMIQGNYEQAQASYALARALSQKIQEPVSSGLE